MAQSVSGPIFTNDLKCKEDLLIHKYVLMTPHLVKAKGDYIELTMPQCRFCRNWCPDN